MRRARAAAGTARGGLGWAVAPVAGRARERQVICRGLGRASRALTPPLSAPAPHPHLQAQELLAKGVHPTVVSDAFAKAVAKANEVLEGIATPVDLADKEALVRAANT